MEKGTADIIVNVFAILQWVGAGLGIIIGAVLLLGGAFLAGAADTMLPAWLGVFASVMGVFMLAMGILQCFIGLGLWRRRNWARLLVVILAWIGAVMLVLGFFGTLIGSALLPGMGGVSLVGNFVQLIFQGAIIGVVLWLFQFEPAVVGLFRQGGAAEPTPQTSAPVSPVAEILAEPAPEVPVQPAKERPAAKPSKPAKPTGQSRKGVKK